MRIVVGHANPDFDAYAATVAAVKRFPGAKGVFLGSQNRSVRAFHNLHQEFLDFVDLKELDLGEIEQLVMVDTREPRRIGELGPIAMDPAVEVTVYDHHPAAEGDIVGADDHSMDTGATTSILVHELIEMGVELTPLEASLMLLGIHEDTGSLTYPNTTPFDAAAAMHLMGAGADLEVLGQFLTHTLTLEQRALLDQLIGRLQVWDVNGNEVAVSSVRIDEYVDSASVVTHYLCEDMGYRVVVVAIAMPDRLYVVGRSRLAEVDIAAVLSEFGGGGHSQAASAALPSDESEGILDRLRVTLERHLSPPLTALQIGSSPLRTVGPETSMDDAADLMRTWGHGGLPVIDDGRLVGLITRKDSDKATRHGLEHAPVKGFMSREVTTVPPDMGVDALERLMSRESIGRLPVMVAGKPVAIVTRKDVLRAKHGDDYLERRSRGVTPETSVRFMRAFKKLLPTEQREVMEDLGRLADEMDLTAHVVGGFVRDMMLGLQNLDVDVVVEGDGAAFAQAAAARLGGRVVVHRRFGTAVLVLRSGSHVDIASARTEYYTRPGALPTVEASSLRQDLLRRDFSINAMAACINPDRFGAVSDPFGGMKDLEGKLIRVLHSLSFVEDPTRVFRAARFERRLGFTIDPTTEALARRCVEMDMLSEVSGARIRAELFGVLEQKDPVPAIERLAELGALQSVAARPVDVDPIVGLIRRIASSSGSLGPYLSDSYDPRYTLAFGLAAHSEHAEADRWAQWLRLGRAHRQSLASIVDRGTVVASGLEAMSVVRDSHVEKMLSSFSEEGLVVLHAMSGEHACGLIERYLSEIREVRAAVTGDDVMALGLEPSERFSAILERAKADRLDGVAVGREAELQNLERLVRESTDPSAE